MTVPVITVRNMYCFQVTVKVGKMTNISQTVDVNIPSTSGGGGGLSVNVVTCVNISISINTNGVSDSGSNSYIYNDDSTCVWLSGQTITKKNFKQLG